ncbi:hypothetical protein NC651_030462 [Populus alba x Populus x berolinensis]|nr:hypothetical protein NC651_030462 [Populus alba x Populus x berolinensis]
MKDKKLVSSRSFFKLYFDNDNALRLLFSSRIAAFYSLGNFSSIDRFTFMSADDGVGYQKRLKIDFDGNLRLYSQEDGRDTWVVSWQAPLSPPCRIHGTCGPNSNCSYVPDFGKCSCLPGFQIKDNTDWSLGCEPEVNLSCGENETCFLQLTNVEFLAMILASILITP